MITQIKKSQAQRTQKIKSTQKYTFMNKISQKRLKNSIIQQIENFFTTHKQKTQQKSQIDKRKENPKHKK